MVLSADDLVHDEGEEGEEGEDDVFQELVPKRRKKISSKTAARSAGSARVKSYDIPMPLAYQAAPGGYQKYKLSADKRVYQRREFDCAEENKVGDVVAVEPAPPTLYPDLFKFNARAPLAKATEEEGPTLQYRIEARIVRRSFGFFVQQDLPAEGPPDDGEAQSNHQPPSRATSLSVTDAL